MRVLKCHWEVCPYKISKKKKEKKTAKGLAFTIYRYASGPIVTLIVGESQTRFFLPKSLLITEAGDFFSKMLKGPFIEAETNQISLAEEDPRSFELFIDWLYRGTIPPIPTNLKVWDKTLGVELREAVGILETELVYFHLYSLLADMFCLPRLKK